MYVYIGFAAVVNALYQWNGLACTPLDAILAKYSKEHQKLLCKPRASGLNTQTERIQHIAVQNR